MKPEKKYRRLAGAGILILASLSALLFVVRRTPSYTPGVETPTVAATFFPLKDIVANIAGDDVRVLLVVPPGSSPHTFEPTPALLRDLKSASAVYGIGHGLDNWSIALTESAGSDFVIVDAGIALRQSDEGEERSDGKDPHYWLTIPNAKRIAQTVAEDLSARFPDLAPGFRARLSAYQTELDRTDAEIRETLKGAKNRNVVTFHDAWYYFADAYGLTVAGTFEPSAGREPTPQFLAELSKTVSRAGIRTIYHEPEFSPDAIRAFAEDHGLTLRVVDPEGISGGSYSELMLQNAQAFAQNE